MFDPTMKKKKKKKKVLLDLDALEEPNASLHADDKSGKPSDGDNQENDATEEKEEKGKLTDGDQYIIKCRHDISLIYCSWSPCFTYG